MTYTVDKEFLKEQAKQDRKNELKQRRKEAALVRRREMLEQLAVEIYTAGGSSSIVGAATVAVELSNEVDRLLREKAK